MSVANYAPIYEFKGAVRATSAPSNNADLVRKQDVSGLSFISGIASGSSSMISVSGGELSVNSLLISDVTVDASAANLAAFLTANPSHGLQKGDVLVLTSPSPSESWIHNGGSGAGGFTQLNTGSTYSAGTGLTLSGTTFSVNLAAGSGISVSGANISHNLTAGTGLTLSGAEFSADQSYIRSALSGSAGVSYNNSTGAITANSGDIRGFFSGSAGVNFDASNGQITADTGEIRGLFSGNAGVTYNNANGQISLNVPFLRHAVTNQSLTANTALTITHNLGEKLVHVSALRTSDSKAVDLEVEYLSTSQLKVKSGLNLTVDIAITI